MQIVIDIDKIPKNDHERWVLSHGTPLSEVLESIKEEIYNPNEMDGFENSNIWQKWFVNLIDKYGKEQK